MSSEIKAWKPQGTDADTKVSAKVLARIANSVPPNTRKAYATDWRKFSEWCDEVGRTAMPCTAETLAEYTSHMVDLGRKPSSIMRAISAIRVIHELNGQHPPRTLPSRAVIRDYRNERADAGLPNEKQAAPLSIRQLKIIAEALNTGSVADQRDRLILVLGWAMMARRSELARLNIADVTEVENGLEVMIRKAKADQAAAGRKVAIPYGSDPLTCPVRLTRAWLATLTSRGIISGPFFRRIDAKGRIWGDSALFMGHRSVDGRLGDRGVYYLVKKAVQRAGLDIAAIQAHSLRAGGATGAYMGGADLLSISRHGGWKDGSSVMTRYIRDVDAWKKNPMHGAGL